MKNNDFEKYIGELSPELQEKARQCKNIDELNKLIAENDMELSDDVLEAVAGGTHCSQTDPNLSQGDITEYKCPKCGNTLRYWDRSIVGNRYYCDNPGCVACQNDWRFFPVSEDLGDLGDYIDQILGVE